MKYLLYINETPIPVIRKETQAKFDGNKATLRDLIEEVEYVLENLHDVLTREGVVEMLISHYGRDWDLTLYGRELSNILNMLKQGAEVSASYMLAVGGQILSIKDNLDKNVLEIIEPEAKNTKYGIVYIYRFSIVQAGRVGLG